MALLGIIATALVVLSCRRAELLALWRFEHFGAFWPAWVKQRFEKIFAEYGLKNSKNPEDAYHAYYVVICMVHPLSACFIYSFLVQHSARFCS